MGTSTLSAATSALTRQHVQRRRAVDDDEVVAVAHRRQRIAQPRFAALARHQQPHFGRGQVLVGGQQPERAVDHRDDGLLGGAFAQQHFAAAQLHAGLFHAAAHGGIALRVQVDQQHAPLRRRQRRSQVHGGGGLAHTALLVRHCNYAFHCAMSRTDGKRIRHGAGAAPAGAARRRGPAHRPGAPPPAATRPETDRFIGAGRRRPAALHGHHLGVRVRTASQSSGSSRGRAHRHAITTVSNGPASRSCSTRAWRVFTLARPSSRATWSTKRSFLSTASISVNARCGLHDGQRQAREIRRRCPHRQRWCPPAPACTLSESSR